MFDKVIRTLGVVLLAMLLIGSVLHGEVQELLSTLSYLAMVAIAATLVVQELARKR